MLVTSLCSLCSYPISFSTEDHENVADKPIDPLTGNRDYFADCDDCGRAYRFSVNPDHGGSVDIGYYQSLGKRYITLYRYQFDTEQIAQTAAGDYWNRAVSVVEQPRTLRDGRRNLVQRTIILHSPNEDGRQSASLILFHDREVRIAYSPDLEYLRSYERDPRSAAFQTM